MILQPLGQQWFGEENQNIVRYLTSFLILTTTVWGRYYHTLLKIRKWRLRGGAKLSWGYGLTKWRSWQSHALMPRPLTACSRQLPTRSPSAPHLLYPRSCVISSPWVQTGASDLLLTNRTQQRWWDITPMIRLQTTVISVSLAFSLSCSLAHPNETTTFLRCSVDGPHDKDWEDPWPTARPESLVQQPVGKWIANKHIGELRVKSSRQTFRWDCNLS